LVLGFTACSGLSTEPTVDRISLSADRGDYVSGQDIVVRLSNDGTRTIGFSWCELSLERLDAEEWTAVPPAPRACALALYVLEPGKQDEAPLPLDAPLPPDSYRLLLQVRPDDFSELHTVRSAPFTVGAE
jgi:hypothetical protein